MDPDFPSFDPSTDKPVTQPAVNHVATIFGGTTNGMLNKIYEYVKELHEDKFPDHQDHQE